MVRNSNTILQLYSRVRAPCRDYCGLTVSLNEITLNIWHVACGPHVYPDDKILSVEEFAQDKQTQRAVQDLFGKYVLEFTMKVCRHEKSIENVSNRAFLKIINYLATRDVLNLSQTSKIMFERCNENDCWKRVFRKFFELSPDELREGRCVGWKNLLQEKLEENLLKMAKTSRTSTTLKPLKAVSKASSLLNNSSKHAARPIRNPLMVQNIFGVCEGDVFKKTKLEPEKSAASLAVAKNCTQNYVKTSAIKAPVNVNYVKSNAQKIAPVLKPPLKPIRDGKIKIEIPRVLAGSAACNNVHRKTSTVKSKFTLKQN